MMQAVRDLAGAAVSAGSAATTAASSSRSSNWVQPRSRSASGNLAPPTEPSSRVPSADTPPAYSVGDSHSSMTTESSSAAVEESPEFVTDERYFRGGNEPRDSDIFIAVMGVTGSGKSTFISHCTDQAIQVGHSLQGCTQFVSAYRCRYSADVNVYLIDTPGFDDTSMSDLEVLKRIATWLTDSFKKHVRINGILYLHRITDTRMQGSAMRNLYMFRKLCGTDALRNVILVTTMWEKVSAVEGEARVQELVSTPQFWGSMIRLGSRVDRHANNRDSAIRLISALLHSQGITLKVQDEMVNQGRQLDQTGAGIELESLMAMERAKWQREMKEALAEHQDALQAKDVQWAAMMEEQQNELTKKLKESEKASENLKVSMEAMHKEKYDELAEKFEKTRLEVQHLQSSRLAATPRPRSHPGRNRISEFRSFTLVGKYYYFCGPVAREGNLPGRAMARIEDNTDIRLVVLGLGGSFWIHYHDNKNNCKDMINLPNYPELAAALRGRTKIGCPKFASLGVKGQFFARFRNSDVLHRLPEEVRAHSNFDIKKVKAMWLGIEESFVAMKTDGKGRQWSVNLRTLYPGLREKINVPRNSRNEVRIKALALNLTDPNCFAIAWRDGSIHHNSAGQFDDFLFEEFATKNFGTTFM